MIDAYQILKETELPKLIDESYINQLKKNFQNNYLNSHDYHEVLKHHRYPNNFKNEILHELNNYLNKIQNREELQDIDIEKRSQLRVPGEISNILER